MTDPSLPIIVTACSQRYLIPNKKKEKRKKKENEKGKAREREVHFFVSKSKY